MSNGLYIINLDTNERIHLQTVPKEIRIGGDSNFKAIASMGRNNPFYHYTGAEDSIEFTISWYANEDDRKDVIRNCKWLQSWTRADGDNSGPPDIRLFFGQLFRDGLFKLTSANYEMSLFDRPHNMLPTLAMQHLTFKRITQVNSEHGDIKNPNW